MSKKFISKHKIITSGVAIALSAVILLGGTFAWQSISQEALNEVSAVVNPGGRLHDDFVEITYDENGVAVYDTMTYNKDVYAENFTSLANNGVQVFARVRLDEYMEIGKGAGALNDDGTLSELNEATSIVSGAKLEDKTTWSTYMFGDDSSAFRKYWDMSFGGSTIYMPTFNKDMNSLVADINGTFDASFTDHVEYTDGQTVSDNAEYTVQKEDGSYETKTVAETHTAKSTLNATVISMQQWIDDGMNIGDFWVYDTDGWAYWANPINPDTATGLLLDGINRTDEIMNDDWYYAINVVAQFITYDDIGAESGTGFYDTTEGSAPSENALVLLDTIGVQIDAEVTPTQPEGTPPVEG